MQIVAFGFGIFLLSLFYFKCMMSSRYIDTSFLFIYRNMIKKSSKLNFLYFGKTVNTEHPRLKPIAISFLVGLIILSLILINAIISIFLNEIGLKGVTFFVSISLLFALLIVMISCYLYCWISNLKAEKDFDKYSQEELNKIRKIIEEDWPNFFM